MVSAVLPLLWQEEEQEWEKRARTRKRRIGTNNTFAQTDTGQPCYTWPGMHMRGHACLDHARIKSRGRSPGTCTASCTTVLEA
eukprot:7515959-Pyramimonas_sp.AAC.1